MKKNILWIIAILPLVLAGCGNDAEEKKQDFFVETLSFSGFDQKIYITKPGRVSGKEEIVVSSQVAGRIKSLVKKDGDIVSGDQLVINIADTIANYGLQVQRARSAVGRASLQRQQTKVSLDKSLTDVSIALDVAKNNYGVTQKTTEQSLEKAKLDLTNAESQTQNLLMQYSLEKSNVLNSIDTILHQVDTYLGVTQKYKAYNDSYEIYLGAKNSSLKTQAESLLYDLYSMRGEIANIPSDAKDVKTVSNGADVIQKGYDKSKQLLDAMRDVIINSIASVALPQGSLDGYKGTIDGLNASLQGSKTAFVGYRKQITSLVSPSSNGSLLELNKKQAEIGFDTTRINTNNALFSTEVGVKNAETNYDSLMKNKDIQIGMASNAVFDASIAYQDALSRFNNLFVKAPIPGVIGSVLVDVGQEVGPGTPLFTLSNKDQQTIEMYVTAEERGYLSKDQFAIVLYDDQEFTGTILSISSVAEKNTLYKVVVAFDKSVSLLGGVASVKLPVSLPFPVLPINVVTPVSQNKGFVSLFDGTGIQKQTVQLGRVWDVYIEIFSGLSAGMNIITNDISYFDPTKYSLTLKK